jgi:hypothetical protein
MVFPFTETSPILISSSASRLEQTPLLAMYRLSRIFPVCAGAAASSLKFFFGLSEYRAFDFLKNPWSSRSVLPRFSKDFLSPLPCSLSPLFRSDRPLNESRADPLRRSRFSESPPNDFLRSENDLPELVPDLLGRSCESSSLLRKGLFPPCLRSPKELFLRSENESPVSRRGRPDPASDRLPRGRSPESSFRSNFLNGLSSRGPLENPPRLLLKDEDRPLSEDDLLSVLSESDFRNDLPGGFPRPADLPGEFFLAEPLRPEDEGPDELRLGILFF